MRSEHQGMLNNLEVQVWPGHVPQWPEPGLYFPVPLPRRTPTQESGQAQAPGCQPCQCMTPQALQPRVPRPCANRGRRSTYLAEHTAGGSRKCDLLVDHRQRLDLHRATAAGAAAGSGCRAGHALARRMHGDGATLHAACHAILHACRQTWVQGRGSTTEKKTLLRGGCRQ